MLVEKGQQNQKNVSPIESSLMGPPTHSPQLLVSVRSVAEAHGALSGGAQILDIKEPSRGSLGMAAIRDIESISKVCAAVNSAIPLSVALGEVVDWNDNSDIPSLPRGVTFAKLGLSRCGLDSGWLDHWKRVRLEFESRSQSKFQWVAVAYADSEEAAAPSPAEVLQVAIDTGCAGLLIDTWTKGSRSLLDEIRKTELISIGSACHEAELFFALAGKINIKSLSLLSGIPADVLAIRSAACRAGDRTSALDTGCVREFRKAITSVFDHNGR